MVNIIVCETVKWKLFTYFAIRFNLIIILSTYKRKNYRKNAIMHDRHEVVILISHLVSYRNELFDAYQVC